jgi:hypothetical protein
MARNCGAEIRLCPALNFDRRAGSRPRAQPARGPCRNLRLLPFSTAVGKGLGIGVAPARIQHAPAEISVLSPSPFTGQGRGGVQSSTESLPSKGTNSSVNGVLCYYPLLAGGMGGSIASPCSVAGDAVPLEIPIAAKHHTGHGIPPVEGNQFIRRPRTLLLPPACGGNRGFYPSPVSGLPSSQKKGRDHIGSRPVLALHRFVQTAVSCILVCRIIGRVKIMLLIPCSSRISSVPPKACTASREKNNSGSG